MRNLKKEDAISKKKLEVSNPYDLISGETAHFHYTGGLTTPPCTEDVNWYVMETPISISVLQYAQLVDLEHDYVNPETCEFATLMSEAGDTNRPIQPLNGRTIEYRCG